MGKGQKIYEYNVFFSKKKHKLKQHFHKMLPQSSIGFLIQQNSVNPTSY